MRPDKWQQKQDKARIKKYSAEPINNRCHIEPIPWVDLSRPTFSFNDVKVTIDKTQFFTDEFSRTEADDPQFWANESSEEIIADIRSKSPEEIIDDVRRLAELFNRERPTHFRSDGYTEVVWDGDSITDHRGHRIVRPRPKTLGEAYGRGSKDCGMCHGNGVVRHQVYSNRPLFPLPEEPEELDIKVEERICHSCWPEDTRLPINLITGKTVMIERAHVEAKLKELWPMCDVCCQPVDEASTNLNVENQHIELTCRCHDSVELHTLPLGILLETVVGVGEGIAFAQYGDRVPGSATTLQLNPVAGRPFFEPAEQVYSGDIMTPNFKITFKG